MIYGFGSGCGASALTERPDHERPAAAQQPTWSPLGWPQPKQMTNSQRPDDQIAALPPNRRTVDGTWRQSEQGRATGDLGGSPVCDTEWKFGAAVHIEVQK